MRAAAVRCVALWLALAALGLAEEHREAARNQHYCDLTQRHTLCSQRSTRDTCGYVRRRRLTIEEAKEILHRHNQHRQNVSLGLVRGANGFLPKAANMMQMTYDMELHDIAQGAADRCMGGRAPHDCGDCRKIRRGGVGQNVAEIGVSWGREPTDAELRGVDFDAVAQMGGWEKQNRITTYDEVARCCHGGSGHFIQMIWANSHKLGCGYIEYGYKFGFMHGLRARLYCNYFPGGNYVGQAAYKIGEPCSACPPGTSCSREYPGLCV